MKDNIQFYCGKNLLNSKDIVGDRPEIFISCGNNSIGKTTFFVNYLVDNFLTKGEKFVYLVRFKNEINNISNKIFSDVFDLFYPNKEYSHKTFDNKNFATLYIDKKECGYAIPINQADKVKKNSHLMNDTSIIFFDEFQADNYCHNEIEKFFKIHVALAREKNTAVKYLPVIMVSNNMSLVNPYFVAMDIADKIDKKEGIYKFNGVVLEMNLNKSISNLQKQSKFNSVFKNTDFFAHVTDNKFANDNTSFIEDVKGKYKYLATIKFNSKMFGVYDYQDFIYISQKYEKNYKIVIACTPKDHDQTTVIDNTYFSKNLLVNYERGYIRFENQLAKTAFIKLVGRY